MGIHLFERGTVHRVKHPKMIRTDNGDIIAEYAPKKDVRFVYVFIGNMQGTLTFNDEVISKHPRFKNIDRFEDWCNVYCAENL